MKLAELKAGLEPLAKVAQKKVTKMEIDLEKAATALLNDPVKGIEKADDDTDADELAKGLISRVESIESILSKATEDEDGRVFVSVSDSELDLAKEFAVDKGYMKKPKKKMPEEEEGMEKGKEEEVNKSDDDDSWPLDMSGKPSRVRKFTSDEIVTSTDPSERRRIRKAKRDRKRSGERCMRAGD